MNIRKLVSGRLSANTRQRLSIAYRAYQECRQLGDATVSYRPLSVDVMRQTLEDQGVVEGDVLFTAISLERLLNGGAEDEPPVDPQRFSPVLYARQILDMLENLVGPRGTLVMNTDSVRAQLFQKLWCSDPSVSDYVFDYRVAPTVRGIAAELFRRSPGSVRSVHPLYNATARGHVAQELVADHGKSHPNVMDRNSPWFKLNEVSAKAALLGRAFVQGNILVLVPESVYPEEFPRAPYYNRPVAFPYIDESGEERTMGINLYTRCFGHPSNWERFGEYLYENYPGLYDIRRFGRDVPLTYFDVQRQFDAVLNEMRNNVTGYDTQFISP